jgi:uncharacterized repeat protein (TIGR03803 family)
MPSNSFLSAFRRTRFNILTFLAPCLWVLTILPGQGQTFKVLYSFKGAPDGRGPLGGLMLDDSGNIYGTTNSGGVSYDGTVFRLNSSERETVLYNFRAGYGDRPNSALARDANGTLYGTTLYGGAHQCGAVFKLDSKGNETVLHSFSLRSDGCWPNAVIRDARGILFGSTYVGGNTGCSYSGCGVVFKMDPDGNETVLYRFTGGTDGGGPSGVLVRDAAGNLYGTTAQGGDLACNRGVGCGTVFKLDTAGRETALYSFTQTGGDGAFPDSGLRRDQAGVLYGTTYGGGNPSCGYAGCGTVFKVEANGKETVLHQFTGTPGDGAYPSANVVLDSSGSMYGTTQNGGQNGGNCSYSGCGVVFKLDTRGKETILHAFTGGADGASPVAGVVLDGAGDVYGTALGGGRGGIVFKLTP